MSNVHRQSDRDSNDKTKSRLEGAGLAGRETDVGRIPPTLSARVVHVVRGLKRARRNPDRGSRYRLRIAGDHRVFRRPVYREVC